MTNQEKALQILNETDKIGILHKGSFGESVAISCIVKALNEKDALFRKYLEKKRDSMKLFPTEYDMCQEIIKELFE